MIRASRRTRSDRALRAAAKVFARPSDRSKGVLVLGSLHLPCALGRSGPRVDKREGDGATPQTVIKPVAIYMHPAGGFRPRSTLPKRMIRPDDGWCDDPRSRRYNRAVKRPCVASHEAMLREDGLYDVVIETDWNRRPAVPGRGSAIFIHIARPGFRPTEGCIALSRKGMRLFLDRMDRFSGIRVV